MHEMLLYHVADDECAADTLREALGQGKMTVELADLALDVDLMSRFQDDLFDYYEVKPEYEFDGVVLPPVVRVTDWPRDIKVDKLIMAYSLYETELYTGKRFIDNPDWQGDPVEMVESFYDKLQGLFVLVDYHN